MTTTDKVHLTRALAQEIADALKRVNARGHAEADRLVEIISFLEGKRARR